MFVRCLQRDESIIKGILNDCKSEYKAIIKKELNQDLDVQISIDTNRWLEERAIPDFTQLPFEELTDEHERQIKIERSVDTTRW